MKTLNVKFQSIEQANAVLEIMSVCNGNFDIMSGEKILEAKTAEGICSMGLNRPIKINIHDDRIADEIIPKISIIKP